MPSFPADHIEAVITILSPSGQECKVVLHTMPDPANPMEVNQGHVSATADLCAGWLLDGSGGFSPSPRGLFDNTTQFIDVVATARGVFPNLQASETLAFNGSFNGIPLPAETALVSRWYTAFSGRSFQGRSFWPGVQSGLVDGTGLVNAASVASATAQLDGFRGICAVTLNVVQAVFSRTLQVMTPVDRTVLSRVLHHQRRRNPTL